MVRVWHPRPAPRVPHVTFKQSARRVDDVTTDVGIVTVPCRLRFAEAVSVRAMWLVWLALVTRSEVPSCLPSLGEVRALPQFVPACSAVRDRKSGVEGKWVVGRVKI